MGDGKLWLISELFVGEKKQHRNGIGSKETKKVCLKSVKYRAGSKNCASIRKSSHRWRGELWFACCCYTLYFGLLFFFPLVSDRKFWRCVCVWRGEGALSLREKLQQVFLKLTVSISHLNSSQQHPSSLLKAVLRQILRLQRLSFLKHCIARIMQVKQPKNHLCAVVAALFEVVQAVFWWYG